MKNSCCKKFKKKKACKGCPVLAEIRMTGTEIKRKEVGHYLAAVYKKKEENPLYA